MNEYYLAVDIGASSGRHMIGWLEDGKFRLEEVYRFENGQENVDGTLCWNTKHLFDSIIFGMKICKEKGMVPVSMGIDTWAVDFVLLDENDQIIGKAVGYRDKRTLGMDEEVYKKISPEDLYARTGIQKQLFNTIYQLMAVSKKSPEDLKKAKTFLMIPDYFNFLLTGKRFCEYTNATTTQLVSPKTKCWDKELIRTLNYPMEIFPEIIKAGTYIGDLLPSVSNEVGFNCKVIAPATHDTGSAVMAVHSKEDDFIYISSGTWSLMGTEIKEAILNDEARKANFTNEGGYEYRFRFLKNIMGLWMIQSVRNEQGRVHSFADLCNLAEEENSFPSRVDVNSDRFLAPKSMIAEIQKACEEQNMPIPETAGQLAAVIYNSLADSYAKTIEELENITGKKYKSINILGGGSKADYLNQVTANACKKEILAGPGEDTAMGNIVAQMLNNHVFDSLKDARRCLYESYDIKHFYAEQTNQK